MDEGIVPTSDTTNNKHKETIVRGITASWDKVHISCTLFNSDNINYIIDRQFCLES